jgi:glycosyltransferase involved in cell wall biosynthesis
VAVVARVRAALQAAPGTILHTHNAAAHYHAVLAAIGLPLGRIVNTRHGMGAAKASSRREWLYRRSMRFTDVAVAVCESARAAFASQGVRPRGALLAIPNGIRVERFAAGHADARAELVAQLGLAPGTRVIGSVGRLNWAKDQAGLIRAFAQVHAAEPRSALVLVGDGALRAGLEDQATALGLVGRVHFLGDRSDVPRLLQGMDLFALSSLTEGYSIALLEACACALPIVATSVGGNGEIVRDGVNGLLVAPSDVDALAAAMLSLLRDAPRSARFGAAGRTWVLQEGSFRTMAQRYDAVYRG